MGLTNFPVHLTSFIGREGDLAAIEQLLSTSRLVTLTGVGGCGKTRLAIQVAITVHEHYADDVWLIDLVPLREPALVSQLVAQSLGLRLTADEHPLEALLRFVGSKRMLLLFDNCEHLTEAIAELAQGLLSRAPDLHILATTREVLGVAGEVIYPVSGLACPSMGQEEAAEGQNRRNLQELMAYDSVQLFVDRAKACAPHFRLTFENAPATVEICCRLDGLPLALELASARMNVLTVQEIADRLSDRFAFLTAGPRSGYDPRHQTLRATIDWSYTLLSEDEQILLRRMAVFEAGCTLDNVEAICSGDGISREGILDQISSLVSKSLVGADTIGRPRAHYRLLETIREYALEKLEEAGEMERQRDRHLEQYLTRAEEAAPKLNDTYQQLWLNWLEGEHDNLRAALVWSLKSEPKGGKVEAGLRIAIALIRFWEIRGYIAEGLIWFERLFARVDECVSVGVHARALAYASFLAMFIGDAAKSLAYGRQAVSIAEAAGDEGREVLSIALAGLASGVRVMGDYSTAFALEEQLIQLLRETPEDPFFLGMALLAHGSVAIELGDYDTARITLDESLAIAREAGDTFRIAHGLNAIGDLARCQQLYEDALISYETSAALLREVDAQHDLASVLQNLGHTCLHLGDIERAQTLFVESMAAHQDVQNKPGIAECLIGFAAIALLRGMPAAGARLLGASATIGGERTAAASVWQATRMEYEYNLDLARTNLSEQAFRTEQKIGKAMSLEQAVDYAQNLPLKLGNAPMIEQTPDSLTRREREVAVLIGQGRTNGEIATELVLSKRTVETHVSKILSKLGMTSRAQVMRWAIDHGLIQTKA
jgi:predicted ATPase/DNA-binding CsgD family transcriptional regulator